MGLFGKPKIEGKELQECLTYLDALGEVIACHSREADLYNDAMIQYGNIVMKDPSLAAEDMKKATKRFSNAATDIIKRHGEIEDIPVAASATHSAWQTTFLANEAWTSAMVSAIESDSSALLAQSRGKNLQIAHAEQLAIEYRKVWCKSEDEYKKLLKQLKISSEERDKIFARATAMTDAD